MEHKRIHHIECHFELPQEFRQFLGAENIIIHAPEFSLHFSQGATFNVYSTLWIRPLFNVYHPNSKIELLLELQSMGDESLAGDLIGLELKHLEPKLYNQSGIKHTSRMTIYGPIKKIVGIGEVKNEVIILEGREEEFACFFPGNTRLPDEIHIRKKTLELIGFELEASGKWFYLLPKGGGYFRGLIWEKLGPEELCISWNEESDDKHLQVLEAFV